MTYAAEVLADSPSRWWRFLEAAGPLYLAEGSPPAGSLVGISLFGPGSNGIASDGGGYEHNRLIGNYLQSENFPTELTNPGSVEFWFLPTDTNQTNTQDLIGNTASSQGVRIKWDQSARKVVATITIGGVPTTITSPGTYTKLVWHHVLLTFTGTTWTLYVDGASAGSAVVGYPTSGGLGVWTWGGNASSAGAISWFGAEWAFYPTALSSGRAAAHYAAADLSINPRPSRGVSSGTVTTITDDLTDIRAAVIRSY